MLNNKKLYSLTIKANLLGLFSFCFEYRMLIVIFFFFLSESLYALSDDGNFPCEYVCKLGMPEIGANDIPDSLLDIVGSKLAALAGKTQLLVTINALHLTDMEKSLKSVRNLSRRRISSKCTCRKTLA